MGGRHDPSNICKYSCTQLGKVLLLLGKYLESALDCLELIFDDAVINIIVRYPNIEAKKQENNGKNVDSTELKGFIGFGCDDKDIRTV